MTRPAEEPRPPMPAFHPSRLVLLIEKGTDGLLVSSPHLPGWRTGTRGPGGVAAAVDRAWAEAAVRAYANAHGEHYAHPAADADDPAPVADGQWHDLGNGTWRSPAGRAYRADSPQVARVRERRARQAG